jgi:hypothetical protein
MLHSGSRLRHREQQVERRSLGESRQLVLLLALMLSVSLTACGTQHARSGRTPMRAPRTSHDTRRPVAPDGRISHLLSANFALLRTPPDGIPPTVRRTLKVPVPSMRWSLARRVPVSLPGTYWLAPGVEDLCIVATTPKSPSVGTVCASINQALRHGIANTSLDPISGRRIIVGVVPKGTRTVLVRSGTSTTSVRVRHGRFVLRDSISSPPDQLTLR